LPPRHSSRSASPCDFTLSLPWRILVISIIFCYLSFILLMLKFCRNIYGKERSRWFIQFEMLEDLVKSCWH
jgi:hypothetical protein